MNGNGDGGPRPSLRAGIVLGWDESGKFQVAFAQPFINNVNAIAYLTRALDMVRSRVVCDLKETPKIIEAVGPLPNLPPELGG